MHDSSCLSSLVFVFKNEVKLIALIIYSAISRVATGVPHWISVFASSDSQVSQAEWKWGKNPDSLCFQFSISADVSGRNDIHKKHNRF